MSTPQCLQLLQYEGAIHKQDICSNQRPALENTWSLLVSSLQINSSQFLETICLACTSFAPRLPRSHASFAHGLHQYVIHRVPAVCIPCWLGSNKGWQNRMPGMPLSFQVQSLPIRSQITRSSGFLSWTIQDQMERDSDPVHLFR